MPQTATLDRIVLDLQATTQAVRDLLTRVRAGYPKPIMLENLRDLRYEVIRPIPVVLEEDDGQYCATWYDADMFGYGDTEQEGLEDLCDGIAGLWEVLKREAAGQSLGDDLAQQWAFLQRSIREVA
jgi:hypothetical protein